MMIRHATSDDASRIAEILIFTKRVNYRQIFQNDRVSFGEMQVYSLAKDYIDNPDKLKNIWVYDDEFVKGMIHIDGTQIVELYVDSFFENQGIGSRLIEFATERMNCDYLWVLEKNVKAVHFYEIHGFSCTGERQLEEGTTEFIIKMKI
ncbi:MAG: GNAT family N-acetyltransferase [Lachnospiraceae bacterium]|nr:GNAT family N-acetyltransferase [Lachnospiraceae bacterium]